MICIDRYAYIWSGIIYHVALISFHDYVVYLVSIWVASNCPTIIPSQLVQVVLFDNLCRKVAFVRYRSWFLHNSSKYLSFEFISPCPYYPTFSGNSCFPAPVLVLKSHLIIIMMRVSLLFTLFVIVHLVNHKRILLPLCSLNFFVILEH